MVWIFGTGRSGNTWLADMMEAAGCAVWREPSLGRLFGEFYYLRSRPGQLGTANYVLGERQRGTWSRAIRNFVLDGAGGRFPGLGDGHLVIKEQVGSVGAPLLLEALPESRVILLVRDLRDVVASWLDGTREGGWRRGRLPAGDPQAALADADPDAFVRERAEAYALNVGNAKLGYERHGGPKVLVRYEELRADALGTLRRLYAKLGVPADDAALVGDHRGPEPLLQGEAEGALRLPRPLPARHAQEGAARGRGGGPRAHERRAVGEAAEGRAPRAAGPLLGGGRAVPARDPRRQAGGPLPAGRDDGPAPRGAARPEVGGLRPRARHPKVSRSLDTYYGPAKENAPKRAASRRPAVLPAPVVEALKKRSAQQAAEKLKAGKAWTETGYVFATRLGTAQRGDNVLARGLKPLRRRPACRGTTSRPSAAPAPRSSSRSA